MAVPDSFFALASSVVRPEKFRTSCPAAVLAFITASLCNFISLQDENLSLAAWLVHWILLLPLSSVTLWLLGM